MDQLASISTRETIDAQLPPVRHHQFFISPLNNYVTQLSITSFLKHSSMEWDTF